jgi:hypothetical protein
VAFQARRAAQVKVASPLYTCLGSTGDVLGGPLVGQRLRAQRNDQSQPRLARSYFTNTVPPTSAVFGLYGSSVAHGGAVGKLPETARVSSRSLRRTARLDRTETHTTIVYSPQGPYGERLAPNGTSR